MSFSVMVVEDDDSIRELMVDMVREYFRNKLSISVWQACDGKSGLEICRREKLDLIISDILMPEMDGVSMLLEIRNGFVMNQNTWTILLSGIPLKKLDSFTQGSSTTRFLAKPFTFTSLAICMDECFNKISTSNKDAEKILSDQPRWKKAGDERMCLQIL